MVNGNINFIFNIMSIDSDSILQMIANQAKDPESGLDSEEFAKYKLRSTDGFLLTKFRVEEDIPDEEFTEEFAQDQIKAINFINSAHQQRVDDAISAAASDDSMEGMLSKIKVPLVCIAIEAQINVMREIHDRAKEMGYNIAVFAKFSDDRLDDLEEERIYKLHGWEDDDGEE